MRRAGALTFSAELLPIDLAIRDWARHDPAVAERLRRVDNRRMAYLRELFGEISRDDDEAEARSMLAFSLAIGLAGVPVDIGSALPCLNGDIVLQGNAHDHTFTNPTATFGGRCRLYGCLAVRSAGDADPGWLFRVDAL
jgi:hypothetical protein